MSSIGVVEAKLPPGFRFHPRDDELICDYLAAKIAAAGGSFHGSPSLVDVDLNKCEPWDLPAVACVGGKEWYFYSLPDRKYATGQRTNRATVSGYWKATGKDRPVARGGSLVGMRKTLVFYRGRAPKGKKTDWVMHEFRMESSSPPPPNNHYNNSPFKEKEDWVLCKVFHKGSRSTGGDSISSSTTNLQTLIGTSTTSTGNKCNITFGQTLIPAEEGFGQVPCFSSLALAGGASLLTPPPSVPKQYWRAPQTSGGDGGQLAAAAEISGVTGEGEGAALRSLEEEGVGCCLAQSGLPLSWNPFLGFGDQS